MPADTIAHHAEEERTLLRRDPDFVRASDDQVAAGWRDLFAERGLDLRDPVVARAAYLVALVLDEQITEITRPLEHPTREFVNGAAASSEPEARTRRSSPELTAPRNES
jgi:hypothetical protein